MLIEYVLDFVVCVFVGACMYTTLKYLLYKYPDIFYKE